MLAVRSARFAREFATDATGYVEPALHRVFGDPGKFVAAREVADDENVRMPGHGQVSLHLDPPGAVGRRREHLGDMSGERHGLDASRPQHSSSRAVFAPATCLRYNGHPVPTYVADMYTQAQLDAKLLQNPGCLARQVRSEVLQDTISAVEQQYPCFLWLDAVELVRQRPSRARWRNRLQACRISD